MRLYKYRRFDSQGFWADILRNNRLFFSKPGDLNDPYECRPLVVAEGTPEEIAAYAEHLAQQYGQHLDTDTQARLIREATQRLMSPTDRERLYYEQVAGRYGVQSFSAVHDHLLLWAHYADSHRGFCIEFEFSEDEVDAVVYSRQRPVVDVLRTQDPDALDVLLTNGLLTKSREWMYEQEYRALRSQGPGFGAFPPGAVTAVILGARVEPHNKDCLLQILDRREPRPRILQAALEDTRFALRFETQA